MGKVVGVLLTEEGWSGLAGPLAAFTLTGPIGKYLYPQSFEIDHPFAVMSFLLDSDGARKMVVRIPLHHVLCTVEGAGDDQQKIGFKMG